MRKHVWLCFTAVIDIIIIMMLSIIVIIVIAVVVMYIIIIVLYVTKMCVCLFSLLSRDIYGGEKKH